MEMIRFEVLFLSNQTEFILSELQLQPTVCLFIYLFSRLITVLNMNLLSCRVTCAVVQRVNSAHSIW